MKTFLEKFSKLRQETNLQPHQDRAGDKMKSKGGVLVYHGLGSGKTLTSLAATQGMDTDVVVPASLRENYKKETKKYTTGHKPHVMSYEQAAKTTPSGKKALVIDEAQMMGREDSARAKNMYEMGKKYDYRMLLSGTPIRNHPSELAPLINTVRGEKVLPTNKQDFEHEYIQEDQVNPGFLARLVHGAKPGVRYRIKNKAKLTDVLDGYVDYYKPSEKNFPSVSHEVVETPMSSEQKKYYDFVMNKAGPAMRWKIKMGLPPSKSEAANLNAFLSGARQVSNSTVPFGGKEISPKIQTAVNNLKGLHKKDPNFKGLVYSNFLDAGVKAYAGQLEAAKIPYGIFDGSLTDKKRKAMVNSYNNGEIKVLLVSGAGSQGIDLKGTKLVQLLEPHWNDSRLSQATGRAARYMSHEHLPEIERHVHVQRYMSTIPKTLLQRAFNSKQKDMSADQYLDMLSKDKETLNEQFYDVLRDVGQRKVAMEHFLESFEKQAIKLDTVYKAMGKRVAKNSPQVVRESSAAFQKAKPLGAAADIKYSQLSLADKDKLKNMVKSVKGMFPKYEH